MLSRLKTGRFHPTITASLFWLVFFSIPLGLAAVNEEICPAGQFLAMICHQMPQRCPVILGHRLGLCSRCLGIHIGALLACVCAMAKACRFNHIRCVRPWLLVALLLPLALDVATQWITQTSSSHLLRAMTGMLYGAALTTLLILLSNELLLHLLPDGDSRCVNPAHLRGIRSLLGRNQPLQ